MATSKLYSFLELFNEKIFRIPDFQRGYSWNEEQLNDFWDDLINLSSDRIHYTGQITLEKINKELIYRTEKWQNDLWLVENNPDCANYIIDGQQRVTTFIILINEILKKTKEDILKTNKEDWIKKFLYKSYTGYEPSPIFGYEKDNPSDEFFKKYILEIHSSQNDKVAEKTLYTTNLLDAKNFFEKKLGGISPTEYESVFKKLIHSLKFNLYEIENDVDVYVTFETMNNRGKPLSNLELLKNRLIYLTTLIKFSPTETENLTTEKKRQLRNQINESWKTIYEYLGKSSERTLKDDDFLKAHWIIYFSEYNRKEDEAYAKFLLNEHFTQKRAIAGEISDETIRKYAISIQELVKSYYVVFFPDERIDNNVYFSLKRLERLGRSYFTPLLTCLIHKESKDPILLNNVLEKIEQYIFLLFKISRRQSNSKNTQIYNLTNNYYQNKANIDANKIVEKLHEIMWEEKGNQGEESYEYLGLVNLYRFHEYIEDLFTSKEGYYSWDGLLYILYEYELELAQKNGTNPKLAWEDLLEREKRDSIEHIYPQTPTEDCWTKIFTEKGNKQKRLQGSLGNLLLISTKKNASLSNRCFSYKVKHEKDGVTLGYINGSLSEIEVATKHGTTWNQQAILSRGKGILEFIFNRYGISLSEWEKDDGKYYSAEDFLGIK